VEKVMVITLSPELEAALNEQAQKQGVAPQVLAETVLRERFLRSGRRLEPQDDWERRVLAIGIDCGVSLPNSAFSSESLYD
jgi:hypothetical protein